MTITRPPAEVAVRNCSRLASLALLSPAGVRIKGIPSGDTFIWAPDEATRNLFHDQSFAEQILAQAPTEEEADLLLTNRFMATKLGWEPRYPSWRQGFREGLVEAGKAGQPEARDYRRVAPTAEAIRTP